MSDDILAQYGNDSGAGQTARATNGGQCTPKPIPYSEPVGPKNKTEVGHSGTNHGCCGTQGRH